MNKKEQAALERAQRDLIIAKAFRFTDLMFAPVRMPVPQTGYIQGYDYHAHNKTVHPVTTGFASHIWGKHVDGPDKYYSGWSQRGVQLYKTNRDALIALRIAKEDG